MVWYVTIWLGLAVDGMEWLRKALDSIVLDGIELYCMVLNSIGWYGMVCDGMV